MAKGEKTRLDGALTRLFTFFVFSAVALAAGGFSTGEAGAKYLGNKACEACHKAIFEAWKKSAHAKTFDLLKPNVRADKNKEAGLKPGENYTKDKSCMKCHVMGWEEGGYSFEKPSDDWKGVGCEDCHGPAEQWNELHVKSDLAKRERKLKQAGLYRPFDSAGPGTCSGCHYSQNSPYKNRDPNRDRNWKDPKLAETYHPLKK